MGETRYAYWDLTGMSKKKKERLLGRNRFRQKDNIERYLKNQDNIVDSSGS